MPNFGILFRQPDRIEPVHYETPDQRQAKSLSLQAMQQQADAGEVALQTAQMGQQQQYQDMEDERAFRDDFAKSAGDMKRLEELVAARSGNPKRLLELKSKMLEQREKLAKLSKDEQEVARKQAEAESAIAQRLLLAKPEDRPGLWPAARAELARLKHDMPEAYPGDNAIEFLHAAGTLENTLFQQDVDRQKQANANEEHKATLPGKQATSRREQLVTAGQAIGAVNDQAGYDALVQQMPFVKEYFGPMFSPALKSQIVQAGMSANDRATQAGNEATRTETQRHNKATEAESIREHNMVDRRAHQQLQLGTGQQNMAAEGKLRDDYRTESKTFVTVRDAVQKIETAAKQGTGVSDIALVYGFMKALDPGSTVREGEYATAANAGGIDDRYRSLYNRVLKGEKLPENVRQQMVGEAKRAFGQAQENQSKIDRYYNDLSKSYGLNAERVLTDYGSRQSGNMGAGGAPATVKMRAPNGQVSDVPADQVSHYEQRGAKRVQ